MFKSVNIRFKPAFLSLLILGILTIILSSCQDDKPAPNTEKGLSKQEQTKLTAPTESGFLPAQLHIKTGTNRQTIVSQITCKDNRARGTGQLRAAETATAACKIISLRAKELVADSPSCTKKLKTFQQAKVQGKINAVKINQTFTTACKAQASNYFKLDSLWGLTKNITGGSKNITVNPKAPTTPPPRGNAEDPKFLKKYYKPAPPDTKDKNIKPCPKNKPIYKQCFKVKDKN